MSIKKSVDPIAEFEARLSNIDSYAQDKEWHRLSKEFHTKSFLQYYMYNFSILGRPIIQMPMDIIATQELIWKVKPDLIIETGIAHGGSLVMSASMLAQIDYCEAVEAGTTLDPRASRRRVLGIDIDIRAHNRALIEAHPMSHLIEMIEGPSTSAEVVAQVREFAKGYKRVMICLDSNHAHDHVLAELEAYAPLTSVGSYCCVFDTVKRRPASRNQRRQALGQGQQPQNRGLGIHAPLERRQQQGLARPGDGLCCRQAGREQIDHDQRARRVSAARRLMRFWVPRLTGRPFPKAERTGPMHE